jgi:hypothetical protein
LAASELQQEETDMTDFDNVAAAYQRHSKAIGEANKHNKAIVFDALAAAGITNVTVEFDGEDDSGQIEGVTASAGEADVALPATPVTLHQASWQSDALTTVATPLPEAIETLCYSYLQQYQDGWENNDGAFGFFAFDIGKGSIELEFNGRFTDIATHNYDL